MHIDWLPMSDYSEDQHGLRVLLDIGGEVVIGEYHPAHKRWLGKFGVVVPKGFMPLPDPQ